MEPDANDVDKPFIQPHGILKKIPNRMKKIVLFIVIIAFAIGLLYKTGFLFSAASLLPGQTNSNGGNPGNGNSNNPPSNVTTVDVNYVTIGMNYSGGTQGSLSATPSVNSFNVATGSTETFTVQLTAMNMSSPTGNRYSSYTITSIESGIVNFSISSESPQPPIVIDTGSSKSITVTINTPSTPYYGTFNIILNVKTS